MAKRLKADSTLADPYVSFDQIRSLLWSELDEEYPMTSEGQWPTLIDIFPAYCIARVRVGEAYGLFRLDYELSPDGTSLEFTGTPQPVEPRYVEKGTLSVIASKLMAGSDAATILADLRNNNPLFARIEAGPNSHPVVFDLTTVGLASQHQGPIKYELSASALAEALPSLIGKPVHVTDRFDSHFEAGKSPKAIGVFIGGIGIDNGNDTKTVRAIATLWDGDFPQEVADIKANKQFLGASYEIAYPEDATTRSGNVVKIAKYSFSGGAILYKAAAAHPETQMLAASAESVDVMDDLYAEVLTTKQRNDLTDSSFALIQKEGDRTIRRFPIQDEAHRKNAWARLPQAKNLSDEERSSVADKVMNKAKSAGDDWAKPYTKKAGKWTKSSTTGGRSMPKYPGIPEDLEGTVQLIVATATREATRDFEHKVEAMQADLKVVQSQMDENVKSKKNMEEAKAKADSELVASGNKVVELTAQLDATKKQAETLTAELKAKADALDVIEVDSKIGAKWKEITATFGVPEDQFEARKPLLRKMVAGKENFTGEDMQQLIAGGTGKPAAKPSSLHSLAASSMGGAVPAGTATKEELVKVWGPHIFERRYN